MADSSKLEATLDNMLKSLAKLSADTRLMLNKRKLDDISQEVPPLENAKVNSSIAYSINCLYKGIPKIN